MRDPCVIVAGFVTTTAAWEVFERIWKDFLNEFGISHFHSFSFWEHRNQFQPWPQPKWEAAKAKICEIFTQFPRPIGVGAGVALNAFEEWRHRQTTFVDPDPYYFCLDRCLNSLIRGITQFPKDEGVAIFVDQDKQRESLGQQMAQWHQERLRRLPLINPNLDKERPV